MANWLRQLRERFFTAKISTGQLAITRRQLTGINTQTSTSAVKKCRAQADKSSLTSWPQPWCTFLSFSFMWEEPAEELSLPRTGLTYGFCPYSGSGSRFFLPFLLPEPVVEVCGWGVNSAGRIWILTTLSWRLRLRKDRLQRFGSSTAFPIHF